MEILRRYSIFIFLLFIGNAFGQQNPVDIIYSNLDNYLEQPNLYNLEKLQTSIKDNSISGKEVQLARTIAYCNIGFVAAKAGDLRSAIDFYEQAKQLYFFKELSNYDIIEYCLKPLGNLYIKTQAFSEAENTIKHYILYAKKTGQGKQELGGILNLSVLYFNRGEFEKSKIILVQALEKEPWNNELKLNLASAYFGLNQKEQTKNLLKEILSNSKDNVPAYQLSAQVFLSDQEYSKAISSLHKALKALQNSSEVNVREEARLHLSLAETYLTSNEFSNSLLEIQEVYSHLIPSYKENQKIPFIEQLYAETTLMDALDLHATLLSQSGKSEESLKVFELASQVNDFIFMNLFMQDSRLLAQQNVNRRSDLIMELYYQQYQLTEKIEWLEKAISLDSKVKGRIVSDAVYLKNILASKGDNNSKRFQDLNKEISFLANEIKKETNKNNFNVETISSLQKSYSIALTQQRILYDSLQSDLQTDNHNSKTGSLIEIRQKATKLNQTIVSYFMGSEAIYQFVISEEKATFIKLTDSKETYEDFRESIRSYNRFFDDPSIINNDINAYSKASYNLFKNLNLPVSEKLIIIPDGILSFVPFQTLLTEKTESRQYAQMPFLIFNSSVSYLLTLRDYSKDEVAFKKEQSVLGVFPVFKNSIQELSYSMYEADAIKNIYSSKMLMEEEATSEKFSEQSDNFSIIHIATHALGGTFNDEASIQFFDRTLSVEELYSLYFPAELVVLSACDTGIGKLIKGEGALSLARAFQYAGAGNVLFSLWQVNDKSTTEWMTYYYKNLKKFQSRDFALHHSSVDYLLDENIDNSQKSPYYWGAFVYYGATDLPQESTSINWYLIGGGILLILNVFLFDTIRRKNYSKIRNS